MKSEKHVVVKWMKAHKKELIIGGVSFLASLVVGALIYKNFEESSDLPDNLENDLDKIPLPNIPEKVFPVAETLKSESETIVPDLSSCKILQEQEVSSHLRNLPDGWKASPEKMATAAEHGYSLLDGQTWVDSYIRNHDVA